jgi:hypothetical protein
MAAKRGKSSGSGGQERFNPEKKYDEFPSGASIGFGRDGGYGKLVQVNDRRWFTAEAQRDPVINAFLEAWEKGRVAFSYLQVKSSSSESEWYIHKPHVALSRSRKSGVAGSPPGFKAGQRIGTYVMNHHRTLALRPVISMVVSDGNEVGQIVYKGNYEGDGS